MRRFSQWFTTQRLALIAFVCVTCTAVASTKLVDLIITNSRIDSTPIGQSAPSTGSFTTVRANNAVSNPVPINTSWMGWDSELQGETDFVNNHGTGAGAAFNWYTTSSSAPNYNPNAPLMSLSQTGGLNVGLSVLSPTITASTLATGPLANYGLVQASGRTFPGGISQGAYTLWNITSGVGETDFVNNAGAGSGGFRWYLGNTSSLPGTLAMTINSDGSLVNSNGFHGNADSATQLNHTPLNCGAQVGATGIQQNGDANCNSWPQSAGVNGWTTLPGGIIMEWGQSGVFDTGPVTLTLPHTFPAGCFTATVTDLFQTASRTASYVSCNSSSITVRNNGSGAVSYMITGH
jgi:hypothetical protein